MAGNNSIRGDETVTFTDNMSFDGTERGGKMTTNGELWIGSTVAPHVRKGTLVAGAGISITPGAGTITIAAAGGGMTIDSIGTQTGTNPIVPDGTGLVTINGAVVAAGTNPVRSDGTGANTMAIEVQISQALAATDATKVGLANFDSAAFDVDANGFVQLNGGGIATTSFDVQANTAPGTDPVVPTAAGVVTVNGAAVANHSVVLETRSRAANAYNLEVQYAAAAAATDATKSGVAHFNSAQFSVDANGFVSSTVVATDLHDSRFIVSNTDLTHGANYSSIGAAITAAVSLGVPQTIMIQPGTYTENLTIPAGINLCAHTCDAVTPNVTISGTCTFSDTGTSSISGICLQTNGANCIVVSGANACEVRIINCFIRATNNTAIAYTNSNGASLFYIYFCRGDITTTGIAYFANTAPGKFKIWNSVFLNEGSSTTASSVAASGGLDIINTQFFNDITYASGNSANINNSDITNFTTSGVGIFNLDNTNAMILTTAGTGTASVAANSSFVGGASSAVSIGSGTTVTLTNCDINSANTNAVTGAGTLQYSGLTFSNTSSLINTTTQVPLVQSNDAVKITTPGAYPYTTIPQDAVILVDTSSARTITPLASPTTGQRHRIKDNVGSAAANNITITPSGKNIDGAASYVIATNWGSADIVYNGTQWNVL